MKSLWKKLGLLLMTVMMVIGMGMTALADDTVEIHVNGVAVGDTIKAYRVISYTDNYDNYTIAGNFQAFLQSKNADSKDLIADFLPEGKDPTELSKLISEYLNWNQLDLGNPSKSVTVDTTSGQASGISYGTAVFDSLQPGYYLLRGTTTAGNNIVYKPMMVFVKANAEKLAVYGEGETDPLEKKEETDYYELIAKRTNGPTLQKKVKNQNGEWADVTSAGVGDTVEFRVALGIPDYAEFNQVGLELEDTMSGLEYQDGTVKLYKDADLKQEISGGIVSDSESEAGKRVFGISYEKIEQDNAYIAYVTYRAKVTADAAESAVASNKAKLQYTLNTDAAYTAESKTKIFNYSVQVSKKDENGNDLNGAEFSFYKDEACTNLIHFAAKTGADQTVSYYYPSEEGTITALPANAEFLVKGLSAGEIYMKETKTPRGYYAPAGAMKITLTENTNVSGETGVLANTSKIEAVNKNDSGLLPAGYQNVDSNRLYQFNTAIKNTSTPVLPSTGGVGTGMFTAAGVVLMILGIYVFFFRKKEKKPQ